METIEQQLTGTTVTGIESQPEGMALCLDNGSRIFSLADVEGNCPGWMVLEGGDSTTLVGATVTGIYKHSPHYREANGWEDLGPNGEDGVTLALSNGMLVRSQADPEGNGPGHMVFESSGGDQYHLFPGGVA